jgi:hypothetical protein
VGAVTVGEEVKAFLRERDFAVLCLELDLGSGPETALVVKATGDLLAGLRKAEAPVEVGWAQGRTPDGPVACLVLRCAATGVGELAGEAYFDFSDAGDLVLLERLGRQERLRVAFLDEELSPVWLAEVPWGELLRLEAEQVRDLADELGERGAPYDFQAAKADFEERLPLDRLLARVFGEGAL